MGDSMIKGDLQGFQYRTICVYHGDLAMDEDRPHLLNAPGEFNRGAWIGAKIKVGPRRQTKPKNIRPHFRRDANAID
jgi:hypothetical protein